MDVRSIYIELDTLSKNLPNLVMETNYIRIEEKISWCDYKSGIHNHVNYYYEYRWVIDNRQYSFILKDGSAIQYYYAFDRSGVVAARQCFNPPPFEIEGDIQEWLELELTLDELLAVEDLGGDLIELRPVRGAKPRAGMS